jgi:6-phosphofructokinase 1
VSDTPRATLAILTSGGDSPGMNAAIWGACRTLEDSAWRVLGVRGGFAGVLRGDFTELSAAESVRFARYGGTFLGTSRDPEFASKVPEALESLKTAGVTHLMVLGGNGSLRGAAALADAGVTVVGIPATIDNDVAGSEDSLGFDSATNYGLQMLDRFRDTVEALPRLCALETLGGDTGFLAQRIGRLSGADAILVPESEVSPDTLEATMRRAIQRQGYGLIVASEGVPHLESTLQQLELRLGLRLRFARPSHTMRGGSPGAHDRALALAFAEAGVAALIAGKSGAIVWRSGKAEHVYFDQLPTKKVFSLEL